MNMDLNANKNSLDTPKSFLELINSLRILYYYSFNYLK